MKTSTNTFIAIWGTLLFSACVPNNDTIVDTQDNDSVTAIAPVDTTVVEEEVFTPNPTSCVDQARCSENCAGLSKSHNSLTRDR